MESVVASKPLCHCCGLTPTPLIYLRAGLRALTLSDPAVEYATAAAEKLEDVNLYVRWAALEVLATLGPEKAGSHVGAVAALLQDKYLHVQQAAIETLRELGEVAEKHADDVAVFLESDEKALRDAATATLAKMGDAGARASMQHILRGAENRLEDGVFAIAAEGIHLLVTTDQLTAAHMEQILSMDGTASEWAKVFQSLMKARVEVLQPFAAKLKKVKPVSNPSGPFENPGRMYSLQTALLDSVLGTTTKTNQTSEKKQPERWIFSSIQIPSVPNPAIHTTNPPNGSQ